jgi:hypothetical protein
LLRRALLHEVNWLLGAVRVLENGTLMQCSANFSPAVHHNLSKARDSTPQNNKHLRFNNLTYHIAFLIRIKGTPDTLWGSSGGGTLL